MLYLSTNEGQQKQTPQLSYSYFTCVILLLNLEDVLSQQFQTIWNEIKVDMIIAFNFKHTQAVELHNGGNNR